MTKIGTEEEAEMDRVKNTKSWRYWLLGVAAAAAALAGGQAQAQVQPGTQIIPTLTCENTPAIFNTAINGNPNDPSSYNNSTPTIPQSTASPLVLNYDQHWVFGSIPGAANSSPASNPIKSVDPYINGSNPPVYNPLDDVVAGQPIPYSFLNKIVWQNKTLTVFNGAPGAWNPSTFGNADWLAAAANLGTYSADATYAPSFSNMIFIWMMRLI